MTSFVCVNKSILIIAHLFCKVIFMLSGYTGNKGYQHAHKTVYTVTDFNHINYTVTQVYITTDVIKIGHCRVCSFFEDVHTTLRQ